MEIELIEYMEDVLGIVGRVYIGAEFSPRVLEDDEFSPLYEDVGVTYGLLNKSRKATKAKGKICEKSQNKSRKPSSKANPKKSAIPKQTGKPFGFMGTPS